MKEVEYQNFDLKIEKISGEGKYSVSAYGTPAGDASAIFELPPDFIDASQNVAGPQTSLDRIKSFGNTLYHYVLENDVGTCLLTSITNTQSEDQGLCIRLQLINVPKLALLPWEYLLNPVTGNFFVLSEKTPIVRYLGIPRLIRAISSRLPLRILAVIPELQDLSPLNGETEWMTLQDALAELKEQGYVELHKLGKATYSVLQEELRQNQYHVIHFIGHGTFDSDSDEGTGLLLNSEDITVGAKLIPAQHLANLLTDHPTLSLVFLNSCFGAQGNGSDLFTGTAQTLVRNGIPAVIAMQSEVSDRSAIALSFEYYKALSHAYSIEACLAAARRAIYSYSSVEWGIPALFVRSTGNRLISPDSQTVSFPEEFIVHSAELARARDVYIEPDQSNVIQASMEILRSKKFLLIKGELGIGKRSMALYLAQRILQELDARKVVRVFRHTSVQLLKEARGSVIIIPDALGLVRFERQEIEQELQTFNNLLKSNYIILTTTNQVLEEALQETRLEEWEPLSEGTVVLNVESYSAAARQQVIKKHLSRSLQEGRITQAQATWLTSVLAKLNKGINEYFNDQIYPLDIKRLVEDRLPTVKGKEDLLVIIRQLSQLDDEFSNWFSRITEYPSLNDDLQCFLLTLAIFDGFEREILWSWYEIFVAKLKEYNPNLTVRPLGALVTLTAPYVANLNGNPTFAHPSFQHAALQTVADSYREYLFKLLPQLEAATIPEDLKTTDNLNSAVEKSQRERDAVTAAASYVARHNLKELLSLIENLADAKRNSVRASAAEILVSAAQNSRHLESITDLLDGWINARSKTSIAKRCTAVITYGRLSEYIPDQAIAALEMLASDHSSKDAFWVRLCVPQAVRHFVKHRPEESRRLYKLMGADTHFFVRRSVSQVLRSLAYQQPSFVEEVLLEWSKLDSQKRAWTLARTCIIIPKPIKHLRLSLLTKFLSEENKKLLERALADALKEDEIKPHSAWNLLEDLIAYSVHNATEIVSLASIVEGKSPRVSWQRIEEWARHVRGDLHLAAASVLSYWKQNCPEKAYPILTYLSADLNEEVMLTALYDPFKPLPSSFYRDTLKSDYTEEDTSFSSEWSEESLLDFSLNILG